MSRIALVWNFEDNNFTWMDASTITDENTLLDVTCMHYGFEPGWVTRWSDLATKSVTWAQLQAGSDPWGDGSNPTGWNDFYEAGKDQNFWWLNEDGVWRSDQIVYTGGVKQYFAERTAIDFDDIVQGWTSYNYKHVRQLFPLLKAQGTIGAMNTYEFKIGWANNLMDDPDYDDPIRLNLNKTDYVGKHKIDVRTTGRYMAMYWDFTQTSEINFTGVDIDIEEAHGR